MSQQRTTSGSSIWIGWKRRVSAGSFSKYFRYSSQVVAAMVRKVPRASAGFSRLAASPVPAAPPAPISVCASSMNRMIGVGEFCTSSITERSRCSNSPFIEAPACIRPISSAHSFTPRSGGGTSPAAMRCAKPSTTAVLPTPASPVRIGLFCRRRISTSMICRISSSRPRIGSISPDAALAVRSCEKRSSAVVPVGPAAASRARRAGRAQPRAIHRPEVFLLRACPDRAMLGGERVDVDLGELLRQAGQRAPQLSDLLSAPTRRWPVRICVSPKNSVA